MSWSAMVPFYRCQHRCKSRAVCWLVIALVAFLMKTANCSDSNNIKENVDNKDKNPLLQGHVFMNSRDKTQSYSNGRVEISTQRARQIADVWPITYYSGSSRYRMHVSYNPTDEENDSEYYIFEAWCGPQSDQGTVLQVFQLNVNNNTSLERIAETIHDYGGAITRQQQASEPLVYLGRTQIAQFLKDISLQKHAISRGGLQGMQVYLHAFKRVLRHGLTEDQVHAVETAKETTILAEEKPSYFLPAVRIRTVTLPTLTANDSDSELDPSANPEVTYVIVEEDSALGFLYDVTVAPLYQFLFGNHKDGTTLWARVWGRRAIYKFSSDPRYTRWIPLGIRAYSSGKTDMKRLERLLRQAWPPQILQAPPTPLSSPFSSPSSSSQDLPTANEETNEEGSTQDEL